MLEMQSVMLSIKKWQCTTYDRVSTYT